MADKLKGNAVVGQSGGPTGVINASLVGVIEEVRKHSEIGTLFGAVHAVAGMVKDQFIDLGKLDATTLKTVAASPSSALGSSRDKPDADYCRKIIEVFKKRNVRYFFYIGGNDSMDTAHKISRLAARRGLELIAVGGPKTIDNDVGDAEFKLVDHTPGYASTARYFAHYIRNIEEENRGSHPADPVLVIQAMGRKIGFIPAAARLADPQRELPLQIYMTESGLSLAELGEQVLAGLARRGRCIVVVSEGFDVGDLGERKDAFGHTDYGASRSSVAQLVTNYLNTLRFPVPGQARYNIPGTDQRHAAIYASVVDQQEAYEVGRRCVEIARRYGTGWMATILREPGPVYRPRYDQVPLEQVANSERHFPAAWLAASRIDVTDDFLRYAEPLIGDQWPDVPQEHGRPRYARFRPIFTDRKCPAYVPQAYRA